MDFGGFKMSQACKRNDPIRNFATLVCTFGPQSCMGWTGPAICFGVGQVWPGPN